MSRVFYKVSPKLWRSRRFCKLPSDEARLAFLYFLTSEHQNSAGCYRLLDGYATADLGWPLDPYQQARKQLVEAGMIKFDAEESEVMIDGWFDHNQPMNDDHYLGTLRQLDRIESDCIRRPPRKPSATSGKRLRREGRREARTDNRPPTTL